MRAQQMPKRRQSVGRAFERAGEFEHRQRGFEIGFPGQNFCRYRALGRVRLVLDIDEPADCRQSILGIDAVSVRYFRRGSDANRCGFGARDSCGAEIGQRFQQFRRDFGWHERRNKRRLLKLVDRVFDLIDQTFDAAVGAEPRHLTACFERDPIGLFFNAAGSLSQRRTVERAMGSPVAYETRNARCDLACQASLSK